MVVKTTTITDYREETVETKKLNPALVEYGFTEAQAQDLLANPDHAYFTWKSGLGNDKDIWYSENDDWFDQLTVGAWERFDTTKRIKPEDVYVVETSTKLVPYEKEIEVEVEDPPAKSSAPRVVYVGGNTSAQDQTATTTTTQQGRQSQGTDQAQSNDSTQSMQGQGNVALVVTPNAESNQQLESQAFGSATQTQQVEVASQADAASSSVNEQYATAAQYHVAPVINIDASDVYTSQSSSERPYTHLNAPSLSSNIDGSTAVLVTAGVLAGLYVLSRVLGAPGKKPSKRSNAGELRRKPNV